MPGVCRDPVGLHGALAGSRVSVESFLAWKRAFDEEMSARRDKEVKVCLQCPSEFHEAR